MEMLIIFIVLTILNVVIQTIKSIATIKCGKWVAALVNAVAYGLYTYVIFFTSCEGLDLHAKALITAFANLVGVFVVKFFEEKARKDKLWKVEATVPVSMVDPLHNALKDCGIAHNYIEGVGQYTIFNIYCPTQTDSIEVRKVLESKNAKYFVSESKTL
jgi:uncharacterized protein YebE (UPF0316 family)